MNKTTQQTAPHSNLEYTFDNPNHRNARWGKMIKSPSPKVVRLAYIGTGGHKEIQGCRKAR